MKEKFKLYRLVPIAAADDPNWQNNRSCGEVLVTARSAGDARIVATESEPDFQNTDAAPAEDKTTVMASVFRNEKLYTVIEDISGRYTSEGPRAILSGAFDSRVILPLVARDQ